MGSINEADNWARQRVGKGGIPVEDQQWRIFDKFEHMSTKSGAFCGVFVSNWLHHAGFTAPSSFASVPSIESWGRQHGYYHQGAQGIERGDILIYHVSGGYEQSPDHTGVALGPVSGGHVRTVEGNTSNAGGAQHYIEYKDRHAGATTGFHIVGYVRIPQIADQVHGGDAGQHHQAHHPGGHDGGHGTHVEHPGHPGHDIFHLPDLGTGHHF